MYDDLQISVLEKGGYTVQPIRRELGSYCPFIVAFSSKSELLKWLAINLESRSPDLTGEEPVDNSPPKQRAADEIPF